MSSYPKRPSHFAHKFVRLIMRQCVANELGPDVAFLLVTIAHTEDAKRYASAVTWFNEQLMAVVGARGVKALIKTRQRAVDAGWLHYAPGAKGKPGKYWVTIPNGLESIRDEACDHNEEEFSPVSYVQNDTESAGKVTQKVQGKCHDKCRESGTESANHSSLVPFPSPKPNNPAPAERGSGQRAATKEDHKYPVFGCLLGVKSKSPTWTLQPEMIERWKESWPAVDVPLECRRAHDWVMANWPRRKTADCMEAFLITWFAKNQNKGSNGGKFSSSERLVNSLATYSEIKPQRKAVD